MSATIADIAQRVLLRLGVTAADEPPSAADQVLAEQKIRYIHADLVQRNVARWTEWNIPDVAEEPYVLMAMFHTAEAFGLNADANWLTAGELLLNRSVAVTNDRTARVETFYF